MEGFSYKGIHCSYFSCGYIPSAADKMLITPEYEVMEADVTGRDGGYYFGNRVKTRDFSLSCYFEDITQEMKEKMYQWLDRNTSGKLVFDDRPFVYYNVRPVQRITGKIYAHWCPKYGEDTYSGTLTIVFRAYDPFGYMAYNTYESFDIDGAGRYCGIIDRSMMPPPPSVTDRSVLIYNCGTQPCDTIIRLAGRAPEGQRISNRLNNQICSLISLPEVGYLELNGTYGTVEWVNGSSRELVFEYHEDGYIRLEPYGSLEKEVAVSYSESSNQVSLGNIPVGDYLVGKYIYLNNEWIRIIAVLQNSGVVLAKYMTKSGSCYSMITQMNEIDIEGTNLELTKLEVDYVPRVY